ncbi:DNA transport protein TraD (plasmid) [Rickettsiales bacterium Ac37b]|nr:DNA transport protein TraD [Rickettsiales bacterium Ac37b]
MSDFIRGGQVTFHKFRMLMQVSRVLTRISLALIISSFVYCYYKDLNHNEWRIGFAWIKRDLFKTSSIDSSFTYISKYGYQKTTTLHNLDFDPYVLEVVRKFELTFGKSLMLSLIMVLVVIGGAIGFFWFKGKHLRNVNKQRGIFPLKPKELKKKLLVHNKLFKRYIPYNLADYPYPVSGNKESWCSGEQSHTLIIGSSGAGKTTIIRDLVYQLHKRKQKAIILDMKGDFIKNFYVEKRGDVILNPLDQRGRNWSIFNETNPLKGFSTIAKSLLPKESKSDPIWIEAARGVVAELASLYFNENLSMSEFADKILKTELSTLSTLLEKTPASKIINEDIEKAALSVLMVLSTYLRPLKLYRKSDNCFSITEWINDSSQNNFLFISSKSDVKEDLNPLISSQVGIAINAVRALKESSNTPKIWFIIDELAYFDQGIAGLQEGLASARSYGGCFVLGTQDIEMIEKIYSKEVAASIANNCSNKIFMKVAGKHSAEWCSSALGEGEIEEWNEGYSYGSHEMRDGISVNKRQTVRKVVLPSELMSLKSGEGYISFSGFEPAKFKFRNAIFENIASSYNENSELMELFKQELIEAAQKRKEIEVELNAQEKKGNNEKQIKLSEIKKDINKEKKQSKILENNWD